MAVRTGNQFTLHPGVFWPFIRQSQYVQIAGGQEKKFSQGLTDTKIVDGLKY